MHLPCVVFNALAVGLCVKLLLDGGVGFSTVLTSAVIVELLLGDAVIASVLFVGIKAVNIVTKN